MKFEFATAGRVFFGAGQRHEAVASVRDLGPRGLVVTGSRPERADFLVGPLRAAGIGVEIFSVVKEPDIEIVCGGAARAREIGACWVAAVGGGSVLDAAKAIAAFAANPGDPFEYLEVVGRGRPLPEAPLPWVALPTTAGTGAEVTRNAVLALPDRRVKVSLRSPLLLARAAIVDPELTLGLPADVTVSTGFDALAQVIEPFLCRRANPFTDALCRDAIPRCASALPAAVVAPDDLSARTEMAYVSLLGGLALANAGLGSVHGFAAPIGGMFDAPHGAVCAALLPGAFRVNLAAARRAGRLDLLARMDEVGRLLSGCEGACADDALDWLETVARRLEVRGLSAFGVEPRHSGEIVAKAAVASSMKANPIDLSAAELEEVLARAL